MNIKEEIKNKEQEINQFKLELKDIKDKINKNKNEIIPLLSEDIKKYLIDQAFNFYKENKKELERNEVEILKKEIEKALEESNQILIKELNESESWDFHEGKETYESYSLSYKPPDLSVNKSLWSIIQRAPKPIDEVFKRFNFPTDNPYLGYSSGYTSPYRLNIYDIASIYGDHLGSNIPDKLKTSILEYWNNISKYFAKISGLIRSEEELRQFLREEMWEN